MPVIVDHDAHRSRVLGELVSVNLTAFARLDQLHRWLSRRNTEYAVVLGPDIPMDEVVDLADQFRLSRPGLSVILLRDGVDASLMNTALKAGVRDVITLGDPTALNQSLARAKQVFEAIHGPNVENQGRVITVFSPKGGVGKTTLAVNLAHALTEDGNQDVCLVDLDLAFGDVAITLQLIPEHTIAEAAEVDEVDYSMLEDLLTPTTSPHLAVLAAPTTPDAKDLVTPLVVKRVLAALRSKFDVVVVDTAPGFDEQVLQALDDSDECVVVGTLDVPTIKNVKVAMETFEVLDFVPGHRHLVLNRADESVGLTRENVESILAMPVAVTVPASIDVAKATNFGQPIISIPDHPVSRAIQAIARQVTPHEEIAENEEPKANRRRGLFWRAS